MSEETINKLASSLARKLKNVFFSLSGIIDAGCILEFICMSYTWLGSLRNYVLPRFLAYSMLKRDNCFFYSIFFLPESGFKWIYSTC